MKKECICRIRNIYRAIVTFENELQKHLGLNINEAVMLCIVSENENISSGEISEEMGLSNSNASKVIASLEKRTLIRRKACKEDLRCMKFVVTAKGKELLASLNCDNICVPDNLKCLAHSKGEQDE
jgi:DNA-binding MarR family transcriptional regulator